MPEPTFDPYDAWLGIPPSQQPADYYRLLGINRFESNQEVIANAVERQMRHIETFKTGAHAREAEKLLNKLATASACLSDVAKKRVYDRAMSGAVAADNSPLIPSDTPITRSPQSATTRPRLRTRSRLVEVATIVLGGVAGLVIGHAIAWYGFGIDVMGVMDPRDEDTAKRLAQIAPEAQAENRPDQPREEKGRGTGVRPERAVTMNTENKDAGSSLPLHEESPENDESVTTPLAEALQTDSVSPPIVAVPPDTDQAAMDQQQAQAVQLPQKQLQRTKT